MIKKEPMKEETQKVITGVLSPDGTNVYIAENNLADNDEGISLGTIRGPDEIELIYLKPGTPVYAGIDYLKRIT
ncbi:MAG TPA: hypothetical protein PK024_09670 [Methanospirillum sp.]|nr:hypothetical protein [Methanospirillum sp.]HOJ97086.1 hypothetical protein [Methanospirillum sp.]HPP78049.1 hypothetical protein [Methanospirillum sp.]